MRHPSPLHRLVKESAIFLAILVLLALLIHPDLLTHPAQRVERMIATQNYMHAFYFTAVVYIALGIFRLFFGLILFLKNKKSR